MTNEQQWKPPSPSQEPQEEHVSPSSSAPFPPPESAAHGWTPPPAPPSWTAPTSPAPSDTAATSTPYETSFQQGDSAAEPQPSTPPQPTYMSRPTFSQPGVIPLRPLSLGDLFEGTFRTIRSNPGVLFGFSFAIQAVVAIAVSFLSYVVFSRFMTSFDDPRLRGDMLETLAAQLSSEIFSYGALVVTSFIAGIFLVGIMSSAVSEAVLGRRLTLGEAWMKFRPRFWSLLGVTVVTSVILTTIAAVIILLTLFIFGMLALNASGGNEAGYAVIFLLLMMVGFISTGVAIYAVQTKLLYAPIVAVLEEKGVWQSLVRSWTLTHGCFWKTVGRLLLIGILTSIITSLISGATGILAGIASIVMPFDVMQSLIMGLSVLSSGLVIPVITTFEILMYLDTRFTKENLAPVLIEAANRQ